MEIRNLRLSVLAERDSNTLVPHTVEISYTLMDKEHNMASDKVIKKDVGEMDLTKSIADLWNECIEEIT